MSRVVIIGGGITGLTAAHTIAREGDGISIVLMEARDRLGGVILTEREKPFLLDGGPDSFLARKPEALDLCREVGVEDSLLPTRNIPNKVRVLRDGRLDVLPDAFLLGVPADVRSILCTSLLSFRGKLRLGVERFIAPRTDGGDETVAGFCLRRMGKEAYERIGEPLLGGIHAGDAEALSLPSTFPDLHAMETDHGSITRALKARRRQAAKKSGKPGRRLGFITLEGGLGDLTRALERSLGEADVRTRSKAREVQGEGAPYRVILKDGEPVEADAVIVATPAHAAAALMGKGRSALARELGGIPYVSSAVVFLAYPRSAAGKIPDSYGFLVPRTENRKIGGCTFVSNKFPGRAPEEMILLRAFVGGALQEDLAGRSEGELIGLVQSELRDILGVSGSPTLSRAYKWDKAMVQYNLGHRDRIYRIEKLVAKSPGLFLAGAAYHGSGIPDCIASGRQTARAALKHLQSL